VTDGLLRHVYIEHVSILVYILMLYYTLTYHTHAIFYTQQLEPGMKFCTFLSHGSINLQCGFLNVKLSVQFVCVCARAHTRACACIYTRFELFAGHTEERDYLEDLSISGKIVLKWFSSTRSLRAWAACILLRTGSTDCLF
jgi:hypothetical protein